MVVRYLSDWSVGVLALTNARELMVYPNPIAEQAVFEYALTTTGKVSCELVDIQGRSVRTLFNAQRPAGQHRETLDLSGITAGQYMLVLRAEEGRTNVRVVKQ